MIFDIIRAINGRVKMCLGTGSTAYYFVENASLNEADGSIEFTDAVENKKITLDKQQVKEVSLITFAGNTIPSMAAMDAIKADDHTFFSDNEEDHNISNKKFDDMVDRCMLYINSFNNEDVTRVKNLVVSNNTSNLDRLIILGSEKVISFELATAADGVYVRQLYWGLINKKLSQAIAEIDSSIQDIDDDEFIADAEVIKEDLRKNVADFEFHMKGVTFDKLFHQWPTLLNPSPFNENGL